jgi:uncharacterized repeat protein (TIGR02543 family)
VYAGTYAWEYPYGGNSVSYFTDIVNQLAKDKGVSVPTTGNPDTDNNYFNNFDDPAYIGKPLTTTYNGSKYYVYISSVAQTGKVNRTGTYTVPEGQGTTVFGFVNIKSAYSNSGNLLDNIRFNSGTTLSVDDSISYSGETKIEIETKSGFAYTLAEVRGSTVTNLTGLTAKYDGGDAGPYIDSSLGNGNWYTGFDTSVSGDHKLVFTDLTPSKTYRLIGIPAGAISAGLNTNMGAPDVLDDGYYKDSKIAPAGAGANGLPSVSFTLTGGNAEVTATVENAKTDIEYALLSGGGSGVPNTAVPKKEWTRAVSGEVKFTGLDLATDYYLVARPLGYADISYALAAYNGSDPAWYKFTTPSGGSVDVAAEDVARPSGDTITVESTAGYDYKLADPDTGALLDAGYSGILGGRLTFSGTEIDAAKTYQVVTRKGSESWLRGVRVYPYAPDAGAYALAASYARESVAVGTAATSVVPAAIEYGIKKSDNSGWVIGDGASAWTKGSGTSGIDLNASSGTNVLDAVAGVGGTVAYRLASSYDGAKVLPVSFLQFPARPDGPAASADYTINYTAEKVAINAAAGLQWAQSGSADWTDKAAAEEIAFADTGWGGTAEQVFRLRKPATSGTFASPAANVTIAQKPASPTYSKITQNGNDLEIEGLDHTKAYETSNSDNSAWVTLPVDTNDTGTVTGTTFDHYIRFAATGTAPSSYVRTVSTPINIDPVNGSAVYGAAPPAIAVTVNNVSNGDVNASAGIVPNELDSGRFTLNGGGSISIPKGTSNQLYTVTPDADLGAGTYRARLKITFSGGSGVTYADITFTVTKADWPVSGIAAGLTVGAQTDGGFRVDLGTAPAGAVLRYRAGVNSYVTQAGDDGGRVHDYVAGSDSHTFTGLYAASAYPLSVIALGDANHNESASVDLGYAYTAYAAPVTADVIHFDYADESLKFANGINPDNYEVTVTGASGGPQTADNDAVSAHGYLTARANAGNISVSVRRTGSPFADSAASAAITALEKANAPDPTVNGASNAQGATGRINLAGNFEYSAGTSGVWAQATGTAQVRAGDYLVRIPAAADAFASKATSVMRVNAVYPVYYFANGGSGTLEVTGGDAKDAAGADPSEAHNKYIAGRTGVGVLHITGGAGAGGSVTAPAGYRFTGWAESADGAAVYDYDRGNAAGGDFRPPVLDPINAPVNLYAKWAPDFTDTANWAAVSFGGLGGAVPPSIAPLHVLKQDGAFAPDETWPDNPAKPGYTFEGWKDTGGTTYTVANNSETAKNAVLASLADVGLTATWTDDISVGSVWKTVSFAGYSGTDPKTSPDATPAAIHTNGARWSTGESWPVTPSRTGYNFNGWRVGTANFDPGSQGGSDAESYAVGHAPATATARWVEIGYDFEAAFDADGGSGDPQSVYSDGSLLSPSNPWPDNPEKEGYAFLGWNDGTVTYSIANDNQAAKDAVIAAAAAASANKGKMTFKAVWQDDTAVTSVWKIIAFDTAGGVPADIGALHTNGVRFANYPEDERWPANPSREGYTFAGWKAGDTVYAADDDSAQARAAALASGRDMTFAAVWKKTEAPAPAAVPVTSVKIGGPDEQRFEYCIVSKNNTLAQTVTVLPENADNKTVTWATSDPSVAAVDASGLVEFTGKEGAVVITAAAADGSGVSGSKTFTVVKHVVGIRVALKKVNIAVKKKISLAPVLEDAGKAITGSKITYKSSNPKAAKVDAKGKVTGVKAGKAAITITAANGKSIKVNVNVVKKAVKLKKFTLSGIKKGKLNLKAGKTKILKIKLSPAKATDLKISFKSSRKSVATVDAAGRITAARKGKAVITVKAGGKTVRVKLTVK